MDYKEAHDLYRHLITGEEWAEQRRKNKNKYQIFRDPKNTWVDERIRIGKGTIIFPGCCIMGKSRIGQKCVIWPNTVIINTYIEDDVQLGLPVIKNSRVGRYSIIGGTAELNRCEIGRNVKMKHHSFLGNTEVGDDSTIGAGAITANYDGKEHHKTIFGPNSFLGVNSNSIAPNEFPEGTYIAAGSTIPANLEKITGKIAPYSLLISRTKEIVKKLLKR